MAGFVTPLSVGVFGVVKKKSQPRQIPVDDQISLQIRSLITGAFVIRTPSGERKGGMLAVSDLVHFKPEQWPSVACG